MAVGLWLLRSARVDRSKRVGWWILLVCFLMLYFLSCSIVVKGLAYIQEKDFLDSNPRSGTGVDVIVVLGGGVSKKGPGQKTRISGETALRFLQGVRSLRETGARPIVFSGSTDVGKSEAKIMGELAAKLGVDDSKILVEPRSGNTWEHAIEVERLLKDKDITIGIVTSAMHMKRSLMVFRKVFPNVVALPSNYCFGPLEISWKLIMPSAENFSACAKTLHEITGLIWYGVKEKSMGVIR